MADLRKNVSPIWFLILLMVAVLILVILLFAGDTTSV